MTHPKITLPEELDELTRQLPLLAEPPKGGCMRWGLCDLPAEPDALTAEPENADDPSIVDDDADKGTP